ncbi:hypothetical protein [Pyrococcus kukulkanii]|uniref:hypothetical protein n=1 Tax=Pyrococcus kukulkanii TaxID=1609559 RepID=UPI00356178D9
MEGGVGVAIRGKEEHAKKLSFRSDALLPTSRAVNVEAVFSDPVIRTIIDTEPVIIRRRRANSREVEGVIRELIEEFLRYSFVEKVIICPYRDKDNPVLEVILINPVVKESTSAEEIAELVRVYYKTIEEHGHLPIAVVPSYREVPGEGGRKYIITRGQV